MGYGDIPPDHKYTGTKPLTPYEEEANYRMETIRMMEREKREEEKEMDKTSIGSGMEYDLEKGTFSINVPEVGKTILKVLSRTWSVTKWLFWPLIALKGLGEVIIENPKSVIRVLSWIGAVGGGTWAFLTLLVFFILLAGAGPNGGPSYLSWFALVNAYLAIAVCIVSGKWLSDNPSTYW